MNTLMQWARDVIFCSQNGKCIWACVGVQTKKKQGGVKKTAFTETTD